ncbi:hypothetical protein HJ588_01570 [Flexivirga sp. ID2601S]|uniref:DUF8017 domain-containing protein n=1 Tax=Flexivirga aerilata TaxID=1656889 RepID=A0A849ABR3_9MICO|nr:hypothetical protein [Flexivirga aerilata]NNG37965.1 hypothetical protein [Flexivirga aerilata]
MSDQQGGFGLSGDQPTGPNTGPTMANPQDSYYNRYSQASGEGVSAPQQPKPGRGRGKIVAGLAAALAVVIAAAAIFAVSRGGSDDDAAARRSASVDTAPVTATTWTNPTQAAGARALQPGWQSQTASTYANGQFDVPAEGWKLASSDTYSGYANPETNTTITAVAPARYGEGFCAAKKDQEAAWVALMNIGKRDPTDAGPDIAQRFADTLAAKKDGTKAPQGKLSPAKQVKVNQGTLPALEYTITTDIGDPNACGKGKKYEIRTVTFSTGGESAQLVTFRLLGVSKELPAADLDKIIATFRPAS